MRVAGVLQGRRIGDADNGNGLPIGTFLAEFAQTRATLIFYETGPRLRASLESGCGRSQ